MTGGRGVTVYERSYDELIEEHKRAASYIASPEHRRRLRRVRAEGILVLGFFLAAGAIGLVTLFYALQGLSR